MLRLLIVEDEPLIARQLTVASGKLGHETVAVVTSADEAVRCASAGGVDLALMDVALPGSEDGADIALTLRREFDVPSVFLTGMVDDATFERCARASPLGYLSKPHDARGLQIVLTLAERQIQLQASRDRATHERDQANLRYADILRNSQDAIVGVDDTGRVQLFNRGAGVTFGYGQCEVLGRPVSELLPDLQDGSLPAGRGSPPDEPQPEAVHRVLARRRDGGLFPAEIRASTHQWEGKTSITLIIRDVSRQEALQEQLIQAQKMEAVGLVAASVAHDFNSLMMGLRANLYLARQASAIELPGLAECERALDRGGALTMELLSFSAPSSRHAKAFELQPAIEEATAFCRRLMPKHLELVTELCSTPCVVKMDRSQLGQVLLNLVINARDAMCGKGRITVRAHRPGDGRAGCQVEVCDTGTGMTPEVLSRAFEPFFTTKPPGRGTGLGLSSVLKIVRSLGGEVSIESDPAWGTRVILELPSVESHGVG